MAFREKPKFEHKSLCSETIKVTGNLKSSYWRSLVILARRGRCLRFPSQVECTLWLRPIDYRCHLHFQFLMLLQERLQIGLEVFPLRVIDRTRNRDGYLLRFIAARWLSHEPVSSVATGVERWLRRLRPDVVNSGEHFISMKDLWQCIKISNHVVVLYCIIRGAYVHRFTECETHVRHCHVVLSG